MKLSDVDDNKLAKGEYCHKERPGCFCAVGFPYEELCEACKDEEGGPENVRYSRCVCPPKPEVFKQEIC